MLIIDDCMFANPVPSICRVGQHMYQTQTHCRWSWPFHLHAFDPIVLWYPTTDSRKLYAIMPVQTKDQNQLKKIHEEIGSDVELHKFDQMFEYATSKPFGFLCIDFNPVTRVNLSVLFQ